MKNVLSVPTVAALAIAATTSVALPATAAASSPRTPVGNVTRLTRGTAVTGAVAPAHRLRITVGLASRDPLGLARLSQAVATPGNPQYGRFISVRRFAARFGAPAATLTRVRRALRADGLSIARVYANHLSIVASGPARMIERAFATRLADVRLADGRRTFVNTTAPTVPADLGADVQAVLGLDGLAVPQPLDLQHAPGVRAAATARGIRGHAGSDARAHAVGAGPQPCAAATTAAQPSNANDDSFGYTAPLMSSAYGVQPLYSQGDFGQGQTVVLYETESLDPADIAAFQACYGTAAPVAIRPVDTPDPVDTGPDGDAEAALDVEQIISMAPQASIVVYSASQSDADGNSELLSTIASQDAGKTVSISYGLCEALVGATAAGYEAKLFEEMAVQGQSVFASSGDSGSEACSNSANGGQIPGDNEQLSVSDPASQPTVTGVGGTSLYSGPSASPTAWNGSGPLTEGIWSSGTYTAADGTTVAAGTGGGPSGLWAMPSFQAAAAPGLGVVNGYSTGGGCGAAMCREVPDVSADGDPRAGAVVYANSTGDGQGGPSAWQLAGGTSAAAPLWAAFTALADVQPSCRGLSVGDIDPSLYALASNDYPAYFRDIDAPSAFTGLTNNDVLGVSSGAYPVGPGYDLATGLGSPVVSNLAPALCALRAPVYSVAVTNPGTVHLQVHRAAHVSIKAADSGGVALSFTATGLPTGMAIDPTTGLISGRPTKTGRYPVSVAAEDFATNTGGASFTVVVAQPSARISRVSLTGIAQRRARLRFTVTRPRGRRLRSVTIHLRRRSGLSFGRLRGRVFVYTTARHHPKVGVRVTERHGAVTIRFRRAQKQVRVTLGLGSIRVSAALGRRASRRGVTLHLPLSATDTGRHTSKTTARVRVKATRHRSHRNKHHR